MAGQFVLGIEWDENLTTAGDHKKLLRDSMRDMGIAHKYKHLPKHFEPVPETRVGGPYGYAPRSVRWQKRKAREGKPLQANVYSGRMRDTIVKNSQVTATQYRSTVYVKNYFPMREQQRKEIEATTDDEREWLCKRTEKTYTQRAGLPIYKRRRRVKIKNKQEP